jgi:hypothetical protein
MGALPTVPLPIITQIDAVNYFCLGPQAQNAPEFVQQVQLIFDNAFLAFQAINPPGTLTPTILEMDVQGTGSGGQWGGQLLLSFTFLDDFPSFISGSPIFFDDGAGAGVRQVMFYEAFEATTPGLAGNLATVRILQAPVPDVPPPAPPLTSQRRFPFAWTVASAGDANKYLAGFLYLQTDIDGGGGGALLAGLAAPAAPTAAALARRAAVNLPPDIFAAGAAIVAAARKKDPTVTARSLVQAALARRGGGKAAAAKAAAAKVAPK